MFVFGNIICCSFVNEQNGILISIFPFYILICLWLNFKLGKFAWTRERTFIHLFGKNVKPPATKWMSI